MSINNSAALLIVMSSDIIDIGIRSRSSTLRLPISVFPTVIISLALGLNKNSRIFLSFRRYVLLPSWITTFLIPLVNIIFKVWLRSVSFGTYIVGEEVCLAGVSTLVFTITGKISLMPSDAISDPLSVMGKKANLVPPKTFMAVASEEVISTDSTFLSINSDAVVFDQSVYFELIVFCNTCLLLILPTGSLPTTTTIPSTYICGPIARNVATCGRSVSCEIDKDGRLNM